MTTPPPQYPGQDPNAMQPYPGQDPYAHVLHEGDCVSNDGDLIACRDPNAVAKVVSIHEGSADTSVCADDELARPYTLRPRVVCLSELS